MFEVSVRQFCARRSFIPARELLCVFLPRLCTHVTADQENNNGETPSARIPALLDERFAAPIRQMLGPNTDAGSEPPAQKRMRKQNGGTQ